MKIVKAKRLSKASPPREHQIDDDGDYDFGTRDQYGFFCTYDRKDGPSSIFSDGLEEYGWLGKASYAEDAPQHTININLDGEVEYFNGTGDRVVLSDHVKKHRKKR